MIGDADLDAIILAAHDDADELSVWRILERVVDQVDHRNFDGALVEVDQRQIFGNAQLEGHLFTLGAHAASFDGPRHDFTHPPGAELVRRLAALDLGKVEHVLDQRPQTLALADDDLQILPAFLVIFDATALEQLAEHAHQRERCFQFVRHVRHEITLQIGELSLALRGHQDHRQSGNYHDAG